MVSEIGQDVAVFGTNSTEIFYDNANATGSSFNVRTDIDFTLGAVNYDTLWDSGDGLFFVSLNPAGDSDVVLMQNYQIVIDSNSINLIREFNNYSWKLTGSIPQDNFNHGIDSCRYLCQYLLTRSVPHGNYFIR